MLLRIAFIGTAAALAANSFSPSASRTPVERAARLGAPSHCDTTTRRGASLREYILPMVTAVGPSADRVRAWSYLPSEPASIVTLVTNDSVCTAVYMAQVRLKHDGDSTRVGSIGLVQAGPNRYVVQDMGRRAGEWMLLDIYDTSLHYLVSITR